MGVGEELLNDYAERKQVLMWVEQNKSKSKTEQNTFTPYCLTADVLDSSIE